MSALRLRHVLRIGPRPREALDPSMEVTFAPMEAIRDGAGGLDPDRVRLAGEVMAGSYNYFEDGDVLLAKVTPCFENGKKALAAGLANGVGFATSEVHVLRPDPERIEGRFLLHLLSSAEFQRDGIRSMTGAGGLKRVSEAAVLNHRLAVTDPADQRRFADFLDGETAHVDGLIERKQQQAEKLREALDSLIESLIWIDAPMARLGHHVDILSGYPFASEDFSHASDDVPLLRGVNISPGALRWDQVVYWPRNRVGEVESFLLSPGDVVLGMDRPWISSGMRVAVLTEEDAPALLLQRVCRLSPRRSLDKGYMTMLVRSRRFLGHFEPVLTGISVPHISPDQIRAFRFPFASLDQQTTAARRFEAFQRSVASTMSAIRASIVLLREHRAALITAAVSGQIDPAAWCRSGAGERALDRVAAAAE